MGVINQVQTGGHHLFFGGIWSSPLGWASQRFCPCGEANGGTSGHSFAAKNWQIIWWQLANNCWYMVDIKISINHLKCVSGPQTWNQVFLEPTTLDLCAHHHKHPPLGKCSWLGQQDSKGNCWRKNAEQGGFWFLICWPPHKIIKWRGSKTSRVELYRFFFDACLGIRSSSANPP